jgi:hypothetical protein
MWRGKSKMRKRKFVNMFNMDDKILLETIMWYMEKRAEDLKIAKQRFNDMLDQKLDEAEAIEALKELYRVLDASADIEMLKYDVKALISKLDERLERKQARGM